MKLAIFDMDGTLLDSMPMWREFDKRFLLEHNIQPPADGRPPEHMTLEQTAVWYHDCFPQLNMTTDEIIESWKGFLKKTYRTEVKERAGALDYLVRLRENGIKTALATVTDRCYLDDALSPHDMLDKFDYTVTVEEVGKGKRHPDIYLGCCEKLGIAQQDTVVFEDSLYAATTAFSAGFRVCGVFEPLCSGTREEFSAVCSRIIPDFSQIDLIV